MKTLVLCCVSLALVVLGNAQCDPPSESRIEDDLTNILKNQVGEDSSVTVDISKYHYTCQAIYDYNKYREVSLIIEYTKDGNSAFLYAQIQLLCVQTGGNSFEWDRKNEFTQRDNDNLFSLTTRVNCSTCSKNDNDNSHCEACHSDCLSVGLGACTGGGPSDCCFAFDTASEECVPSCPTNYSPNETFFCACSLKCPSGNILLTNNCTCQETHICLVNDPCINGGNCTIMEGDSNYTCDCQDNFSGENCSVCSIDCPLGNGVMTENCSCIETHVCLLNDPCENKGSCVIHEGNSNYTCNCPVNYSGMNCTECSLPCEEGYEANSNCAECVLADICLGENPCKNQGQCTLVNKPDVYECDCVGPGNYTGTTCTECGIRCQNGGTVNSNCTSCVCSSRYTGKLCEEEIDYCDPNSCGRYGTCLNNYEAKEYTCLCDEGWEGPDCGRCFINNCVECTDGKCVQCVEGYGRRDGSCVACDDSQCKNCSDNSLVCGECMGAFTTDLRGKCVSALTATTAVSPSSPVGIGISVVFGVLMLILLIVVIGYIIYYFLDRAAIASRKAKPSMPFVNGEAHDNPMYLKPEVVEEVAT